LIYAPKIIFIKTIFLNKNFFSSKRKKRHVHGYFSAPAKSNDKINLLITSSFDKFATFFLFLPLFINVMTRNNVFAHSKKVIFNILPISILKQQPKVSENIF